MEALAHLHHLMEEDDVLVHFKSQPTKLFKEAMQYILPKSLLEPIYHCFYYFEVLDVRLGIMCIFTCIIYMYSVYGMRLEIWSAFLVLRISI